MLAKRLSWALLFSLVGCGKSEPPPVPTAVSVAASVAPVVQASAAVVASATPSPKKGRSKAEPAIKKEARQAYQSSLADGRKLAQSRKWTEAMARYEEALKAKPEDPVALGEMGFAAYHAGELDRARTFNARALKVATEPGLRASILYNEGLIDEKKSEKDAARKHYEASLALRPNATVQGRLEQLGPAGACDARFTSRKELESCLRKFEAPDLFRLAPSLPVVFEEKGKGPGGLVVIQWGQQDGPERPYMLIAEGAWGARRLAMLGTDYEPGAFGVHNEGSFERFEQRKIGGHELVLVRWGQSNYDSNMAGLQADTYTSKNLTVCVLNGVSSEPRCPVSVPLEETVENIYPLEPEDGSMRAEIEEMKKQNPPSEKIEKATFSIEEDGTFKVKETQGKRAHLAAYLKGVKVF